MPLPFGQILQRFSLRSLQPPESAAGANSRSPGLPEPPRRESGFQHPESTEVAAFSHTIQPLPPSGGYGRSLQQSLNRLKHRLPVC